MPKLDRIQPRIERSVDRVLDRDPYLIENSVHEQSISHKLAEYLQQEFMDWNVDCEYNKDLGWTKRLDGYDSEWVRPDVVIHERGTERNLVVIEVKSTGEGPDTDIEKLELFIDEMGYEYVFFIDFGSFPSDREWLEKGRI